MAGKQIDEPIRGMPGIHQQSIDVLLKTVEEDTSHGLKAVMLIVVAHEHKDARASYAHDTSSHLHQAILALKKAHGDDLVVMTDVCLCTATEHGHCGLVHDGEIINDASVNVLVNIALSHAKAGQIMFALQI